MPIATESNLIGEDPSTGLALDDLYKEYEKPSEVAKKDGETPPTVDQAALDKKAAEDKAAADAQALADQKATDDKAAADAANTDGLPSEQAVERLPDAEEPAPVVEESDPALKAFDEVKLRPDASQKTKDSFAKLKEISTAALRAANAEKLRLRQEYEAKMTELQKNAAPKTVVDDPEVKKELEELRGFKATFDIENDPEFKKKIEAQMEVPKAANYEAIYGILKSYSLPDSELKALKEMSESERVANIAELVEKLPRVSKMQVEAKLLANLNLDDARAKAIAEARAEAAAKKAEFREAPEKTREKEVAEVKTEAEKYRGHAVFKKHEIKADTPAEEKKRFEVENARIDSLAKVYEEAVNDATPAGRAENAFGVVLAHHFKTLADTHAAQVVKLKAEIEAIKKRGGLGNVGKVVNIDPNKPVRPKGDSEIDAGSSLDALAREAGIPT